MGRIGEAFRINFATVGCIGAVQLKEDGENYENYQIEILVTFRAGEPLQKLDAQRQSGGERSVSTMLYLVSLQNMTKAPFRVVDEINQGMDHINERKVYTSMVKAACQAGTPQCFLLTPKLLPQLDYSQDVTVLVIFNGPYVGAVAKGFSSSVYTGLEKESSSMKNNKRARITDEDDNSD